MFFFIAPFFSDKIKIKKRVKKNMEKSKQELKDRKRKTIKYIEGHINTRQKDIQDSITNLYDFMTGKQEQITKLSELQLKILSAQNKEELDQLKKDYRPFFIVKQQLKVIDVNVDYFKSLKKEDLKENVSRSHS